MPSKRLASDSARARVRFAMRTRERPCSRIVSSASSIISPAPTRSATLSSRLSKISAASSAATRATEIGRSAIRVSLRTRFAAAKACWQSRVRIEPQAPASTAAR